MDVLRKELNEEYLAQNLTKDVINYESLGQFCRKIENFCHITNGCAVITDAFSDKCYLFSGNLGRLIGITEDDCVKYEISSSDEDIIYERLHPEDLVDKRMLEYEFFKFIGKQHSLQKTFFKATCRIRMLNKNNDYIYIDNSTQIIELASNGNFWLVLCLYNLSCDNSSNVGINPVIINTSSGEKHYPMIDVKRTRILSKREKEILKLIKSGRLSKEIAEELNISINTVNRHRQNILQKLSVSNSMEAVVAVERMRLM